MLLPPVILAWLPFGCHDSSNSLTTSSAAVRDDDWHEAVKVLGATDGIVSACLARGKIGVDQDLGPPELADAARRD